jgi:hypothetical protein
MTGQSTGEHCAPVSQEPKFQPQYQESASLKLLANSKMVITEGFLDNDEENKTVRVERSMSWVMEMSDRDY